MTLHRLATIATLLLAVAAPAAADDAAQANNPLANFTAFNLQNYYVPSLSELDDQNANTFWMRYAQPLGPFLMRASLPIARVPTALGETTSGVGDLNANFFYLMDTGNPAVSFGVGPQVTLPTASEDETGADKYQAGVSAVYFNAKSKFFQWGGLVNWQKSIGGSGNEPDTELLAIQPFYFFQLGKGLYLRGAPTLVFNVETDHYHVPVGLGLGKVVAQGDSVFNFFAEPQFTILDRGPGQPELQFYVGLNMQFK
jgi:hypothetical protein